MPGAIRTKRASSSRFDPIAGNKGAKGAKGQGKGGPKGADAKHQVAPSMRMDKTKGQHLLKNSGIIDKIIKAADLKQTDTVLEIGPGTGHLTMMMLPAVRKVHAIELDPRMVAEVRKRAFAEGRTNLDVTDGDALRTNFGKFDVCVANMPYQISSPFVFKLLAHRPLFRSAVLMFQKEFADRLCAEVGDKNYGRLALNTKLFVKVTMVCKVGRGSFHPPPEVDSAVVKLVPRNPPIQVNFREWDGLMRICFNRKRKTLHANFNVKTHLKALEDNYKTWCSISGNAPQPGPFKDFVFGILKETGLSETRSIKIDLDTFFKLLLAFNQKGIHFVNVAATGGALPTTQAMDIDASMFEDAADDDEDL